jgi:hypothetical protein
LVAKRSAPRLVTAAAGAPAVPVKGVEPVVVAEPVVVVAELAALPGWGARLTTVNRTAKIP